MADANSSLSPLLLVPILEISEMSVTSSVGHFDQATVKPLLAATRLVPGHQEEFGFGPG